MRGARGPGEQSDVCATVGIVCEDEGFQLACWGGGVEDDGGECA